jgi:hypothetical protein
MQPEPMQSLVKLIGFTGLALLLTAAATQAGYQVGDTIGPGTTVLDAQLKPHPLLELISPEAKVVILVLFGGGAVDPDPDGELWCHDSQSELSGMRDLVAKFAGQPVQFLGIAFPAVYSSDKHGYTQDVFIGLPESDPASQAASRRLVGATEALREAGKLPYGLIYYDPRFLLLSNPEYETTGRRAGELPEWAGQFKADQDRQKYGLPTIWLLDSSGVVLADAFSGNIYEDNPPQIRYTMVDLERAIRRQLER